MNATTAISVGQKFPLIRLVPEGDATRTLPGDGFSGFMVCFHRPTEQEINRFNTSPLEYGVFCQNYVPYLLLKFGTWCVDGSFNIVGGGEPCDAWIKSNANLLNIYFIDSNSKLVKGIRSIGLDQSVVTTIKDACIMQKKMYSHTQAIYREMERIERQYDTHAMIKSSMMFQTNRK